MLQNRPMATRADVKVRAKMPLKRQWRISFVLRGELVDLDVVWSGRQAWTKMERSTLPGWTILPIGPFVIGLRAFG